GGGQLVGRGRGGPGFHPGQGGGEPKVRLAQYGRRRRQRAGGRGQAAPPLHDRLRDGARRQGRDAGPGLRGPVGGRPRHPPARAGGCGGGPGPAPPPPRGGRPPATAAPPPPPPPRRTSSATARSLNGASTTTSAGGSAAIAASSGEPSAGPPGRAAATAATGN